MLEVVILGYGEDSARSELSNLDVKYILWQVKTWDWFAKLSPFIVSFSTIGAYFLGYRDWNLVYSVIAVMFVTIAITWWFWVIYTIASIAIIVHNSGRSLEEVIKELKDIRKIINDKKSDLNR